MIRLKYILENKKIYLHKPGHIQDGKLSLGDGRIIIYNNNLIISRNKANDHNDLLRALAKRLGIEKNIVISNAIRMYFRQLSDGYIVNGVRRVDDEDFAKNKQKFLKMIKTKLR